MKFLFVCFCLLSQSLATADVKYNNKDDAGLFCYAIGGLLHGDKRLEKCIPGLLRGRESPFNWKPTVDLDCVRTELHRHAKFKIKMTYIEALWAARHECSVLKSWGLPTPERSVPSKFDVPRQRTPLRNEIDKRRLIMGCSAMESSGSKTRLKRKKKAWPVVFMATIVKDQSQDLPTWLLWHLILGVEHVYIYDNDSTDDIENVLKSFIRAGYVTYIKWPGRQRQNQAYNHALTELSNWKRDIQFSKVKEEEKNKEKRKEKENKLGLGLSLGLGKGDQSSSRKLSGFKHRHHPRIVDFLAFVDVDEYYAPFMAGCLPGYLLSCHHKKNCAGVKVNWRSIMNPVRTLPLSSAGTSFGTPRNTLFSDVDFDVGRPSKFVKSIVKIHPGTAQEMKFDQPHSPRLKHSQLKPTPHMFAANMSTKLSRVYKKDEDFYITPPVQSPVVILHLHGGSLLDWVMKRLIRRQNFELASQNRTCKECDQPLQVVMEEYAFKLNEHHRNQAKDSLVTIKPNMLIGFIQHLDLTVHNSLMALAREGLLYVPESKLFDYDKKKNRMKHR
jgi:hypothetical protein